jgi:hypothetical protein
MQRIVQFNWGRNWKQRVEPHLKLLPVELSVQTGMELFDPCWKWEDGPHSIGCGGGNYQVVRKYKLSWYQPWARCHWISFFACAIGVLNYPDLDWDFISSDRHTVPVGSRDGEIKVVMDILNFKTMTAEESIAVAKGTPSYVFDPEADWRMHFAFFRQVYVPGLRELAPKRRGCGKAPAKRAEDKALLA